VKSLYNITLLLFKVDKNLKQKHSRQFGMWFHAWPKTLITLDGVDSRQCIKYMLITVKYSTAINKTVRD